VKFCQFVAIVYPHYLYKFDDRMWDAENAGLENTGSTMSRMKVEGPEMQY